MALSGGKHLAALLPLLAKADIRAQRARSEVVKVFGCRPITNGATRSGPGVRKPAREETADCRGEAVPQAQLWRFKEDAGRIDRGARMQASDWGGEAPPVMWWGHQFGNR